MNCSTPGSPVLHCLPGFTQFMSIEMVMLFNHLILCHPLLLLPLIFHSSRVFSNVSTLHISWPKYWSFHFSINPSNEYSGLISLKSDWLDFLAVQDSSESSPAPEFESIDSLIFSLLYDPTLTSVQTIDFLFFQYRIV